MIIQKAMGGIFGVALYHYAAEGEAMGGFTAAELDSAVQAEERLAARRRSRPRRASS